ncbi:MAG: DUF1573 domain-containing protein, partial [Phycisphaerae bacterium]|nr:DUF1573 domain-containing protein [Phycisphaerae bacterium]
STPVVPAARTPRETPASGPRLQFENLMHDFGEIWEVDKQTAAFKFTNTGDETLVISDIKTSCGCTTTELPKKEFAPGEGSEIGVVFSPKGSGTQKKRITVISNSTAQSVVELVISANIKPFVKLTPQFIRFGEVELGKNHSERFTISSFDPSFTIDRVTGSGRGGRTLAARLVDDEPGVGEGSEHVIEVTLKDNADWGSFYGTVTVDYHGMIDGRRVENNARLNVTGAVYGELRTTEPMFRLSMLPPGQPFERSMRLSRVDDKPFNVLSAEVIRPTVPGTSIAAVPVTTVGESGYDLILSGDPGDHLGPMSGYIKIVTDVPGEEQLEMRFAGVVRERAK